MKSYKPGASISEVEVTNISTHGLWVLVGDREYFLSYQDYPWFKDAKVSDIVNLQLNHGRHLLWPSLDVDLCLDCLENPDRYPLIADNSGG
jgi:hypothetical protein